MSGPDDSHTGERQRCPECLAVFRTEFSFCPSDGSSLEPCADEPLLGATIAERYVIEEVVGEGAMGVVYRARHVRLPRTFAVKVLFGDLAADPVMRMRFAQEAAAASRLAHPNVVSVVDFGKSERGLLYLAMDFVEGEQLSALIAREGPLPPRRAISIARELARGLGHAHEQGLVHRDFKPENVVLERDPDGPPVPRILDFGLAISARDNEFDGRFTQHGFVVGTPIYIAPEQARDLAIDHRADLFALGVVLYEMLAGKPPFEGPAVDVAHKNMIEPAPAIHARNPAVTPPPELEAVVMCLLEKAPEDRFQSADEVIAALDAVDRTLDTPVVTLRPLPARAELLPGLDDEADDELARELGGRRRWPRLLAAAVLLLAAGGVVQALRQGAGAAGEVRSAAMVVADEDEPGLAAVFDEEAAPDLAEPPVPAGGSVHAAPASPDAAGPAGAAAEPEPEPESDDDGDGEARLAESRLEQPATRRSRPAARSRRAPSTLRAVSPVPPPASRQDALAAPAAPLVAEKVEEPVAAPTSGAPALVEERARPATRSPAARRRPAGDDRSSVERLIREYRQVGEALAELPGDGAASAMRQRYFDLPYTDALRIPAVREDTLASLRALRRDIARARPD